MATKSNTPDTIKSIDSESPNETLTLAPTSPDARTPESRTTADSPLPSQENPHPISGGEDGATDSADSKPKETQVATKAVSSSSANEVEKKLRRAERFGVPVQLSEKEKRNSRAERFGAVSGSDGAKSSEELKSKEAAKSSEELKRKARAERFGLPAKSAADEEVKKKSRLERFGSNVKTDTGEEEKRKARALRFAESHVSRANGKGNVQMETAVTGSSAGGT